MSNGHTSQLVGVYSDEGASPWCVDCTCKTLTQRSYTTIKLTAQDILSGAWTVSCVGIVLPGGRDSPYHDKLKGPGTKKIREFVENGGWYLGICAGGYFGSSKIDFCKGDPEMEIDTSRELAFFPGTAVGPRYPGYRYQDNSGERVVSIFKPGSCQGSLSGAYKVYFNGGCFFNLNKENQLNHLTMWEYEGGSSSPAPAGGSSSPAPAPEGGSSSPAPAVVGCVVGRGRVVLSGVHPEIGAEDVDNAQHLDSVISETKYHDSDRIAVLDDIFMFLEGVS